MSEAERLNKILEREQPAAFRCLSPLGRRVAFPRGIPFQAGQAKATRLKATVGQVTDGAGAPLPLPTLAAGAAPLDPKMCFLYSPQPGHPAVRQKWLLRQLALAGRRDANCTLPMATHGLTHGLSLVADMFADPDTTVILPAPSWENYQLLFTMRAGAKVVTYPFFRDQRFNLEGLIDAIQGATGPAIVVLNFPANPTGYSPTPDEADRIVAALADQQGPLVVVVDDAYQNVVHEPGLLDHSLFWRLLDASDPERLFPVKIDGATKEMLFFASRIGFLTTAAGGELEDAFASKWDCLVRGSVGGPPGPSQAMLLGGLADPIATAAQFQATRELLTARYHALREALGELDSDRIRPFPFNSAYFAVIGLDPAIPADEVRKRLIEERSVGLIAIPEINGLRIAYCSTRKDDLREIVGHLGDVVGSW